MIFIKTYYDSELATGVEKGLEYLRNIMIVSESVMINILDSGLLDLILTLI